MLSTNTYTSQDRSPYTYFIRWNELDLNYYGRRTAKGCRPEEFFITYFTSSKLVDDIIAEYGMPDIIKIHKIFSDIHSCCLQEEKFLTRVNAARSLSWLNQTNGDKNWNNIGGYSLAASTILKMRKPKSENHKQNMRQSRPESRKESERQKRFERTGYYDNFSNPELQNKARNTYFEKTGYIHNSHNPDVITKRERTYFEKTGYTNPSKNPDVIAHQYDSYFEKTGYKHPNHNPKVKLKQIQSYKETCKTRPPITCPHCGAIGKGGIMKRWHFDKCKNITK